MHWAKSGGDLRVRSEFTADFLEHKQTALVTFYLIITPGSHYRCEPEMLSF